MKKNNFFEGIKFALGFFLVFGIIGIVTAVGFHTASEVLPGTFDGSYNFVDGDLKVGIAASRTTGTFQIWNNKGDFAQYISNNNTSGFTSGLYIDLPNNVHTNGNLLKLTSGGVAKFQVGANGYVGIGTTSPDYKLTINGGTQVLRLIGGYPGYGQIFFDANTSESNDNWFIGALDDANNGFTIRSPSTGEVAFYSHANGNVGIGMMNPNSPLQIGTPADGVVDFVQIDAESNNPLSGYCDTEDESGRMYLDFDDHRLYICNRNRGWDYITLTD